MVELYCEEVVLLWLESSQVSSHMDEESGSPPTIGDLKSPHRDVGGS